jgi:putative transposase
LKTNETTWARLLAYVTGLVNQELLLQNEYLAAENRILKAHAPRHLRLTEGERSMLAEIGRRLGRQGLQQVARLAKPDTILGWYRQLVAEKFAGSKTAPLARSAARPCRDRESGGSFGPRKLWLGLRSDCGALANLGHTVSDQTVGNILRRLGIA